MRKLLFLCAIILFAFTVIFGETKPMSKSGNDKKIKISISFNSKNLTATLYDNATTQSFLKKLPLTLPMKNLYDRELVYRFPESLPANESSERGYDVGEIIYYPPLHSFVIMYAQNGEHFSMQRMGRIDGDISELKIAEDVTMTFKRIDE